MISKKAETLREWHSANIRFQLEKLLPLPFSELLFPISVVHCLHISHSHSSMPCYLLRFCCNYAHVPQSSHSKLLLSLLEGPSLQANLSLLIRSFEHNLPCKLYIARDDLRSHCDMKHPTRPTSRLGPFDNVRTPPGK
jgi:hypothetical protein